MEEKTYIGLTPTKEMEQVKSKLETFTDRMRYQPSNTFYALYYRDENKITQFRVEIWKEAEENILEISYIGYIKNGVREGEAINLDPVFD